VCHYTTLWNASVLRITIKNKTTFVRTHFKKLTTKTTCLLFRLLSKILHLTVFTSSVQRVYLAVGRRIKAGDATDQWRDQPNAAALCPTQRQWLSLAGWLSWIVNIDRPSVEGHFEQRNRLNLSPGCLRATCQARSTLITQLVSGVAGLSASSNISRGSVARHLRCGGIYSNSFITNCLLILVVKEFWKSVNIW